MRTPLRILALFMALTSYIMLTYGQEGTAGYINAFTKVDAPAVYTYRSLLGRVQTATITMDMEPDVPYQAHAALLEAANIWSYLINSSQTIRVQVKWDSLKAGALATSQATSMQHDFPGAPKAGIIYPVALAEALSYSNLNDTTAEMILTVDTLQTHFYYGTDGNTPRGMFDLLTIVMHEIGHGLGFFPSFTKSGLEGRWGTFPGLLGAATCWDDACVIGNNRGTSIYRLTNTSMYANPSREWCLFHP